MAFKLPILTLLLMWLQTCQPQMPPISPQTPSQSSAPLLPGSSYAQARAWLAAHPYLSADVIGPLPGMDHWYLIAWRQLEDGYFLDLGLAFDEAEPGVSATPQSDPGPLDSVALSLVQRRLSPGKDPDSSWDPRPWEDIAHANPWAQTDKLGLSLMRAVFGPQLAQDYQMARLLYDGPEYVLEAPTEYVRERIGALDYRVYAWNQRVRIFVGERHGFEITEGLKLDDKDQSVSFKLNSRQKAREDAEILAHNRERYLDSREQASWELETGAGILLQIPTLSARLLYQSPAWDEHWALQLRYALMLPNLWVPRPDMGQSHFLNLGGRAYLSEPGDFWRSYLQAELGIGYSSGGASPPGLAEVALLGIGADLPLTQQLRLGASLTSGIAALQGYYAPPFALVPPLLQVYASYGF